MFVYMYVHIYVWKQNYALILCIIVTETFKESETERKNSFLDKFNSINL